MRKLRPFRYVMSPNRRIRIFSFILIVLCFFPLSLPGEDNGIVLSGIAESTIGALLDTDESWNVAAEQYANLRLETSVGDVGRFFAAFNVLAVSSPQTGLVTEGELERLYASLNFNMADVYVGLMRIPFGYGAGIRPTDIINPQNPLFPDARLKGVMASVVAWYPRDELEIQALLGQRNSQYFEGQSISFSGESFFGLSFDRHSSLLSIQGLAITTLPETNTEDSLLHLGFSVKFDVLVGFAVDVLYTTDRSIEFAEGRDNAAIAAAFGCDYSFLDGKFFILAQYFYSSAGVLSSDDSINDSIDPGSFTGNGQSSLNSLQNFGTTFLRRHYGFISAVYNHSDYARLQLSILASLGDGSFIPTVRHEFEPVQAITLVSVLAVPVDQTIFGGSEMGEFGPDVAGISFAGSFSVKYRF